MNTSTKRPAAHKPAVSQALAKKAKSIIISAVAKKPAIEKSESIETLEEKIQSEQEDVEMKKEITSKVKKHRPLAYIVVDPITKQLTVNPEAVEFLKSLDKTGNGTQQYTFYSVGGPYRTGKSSIENLLLDIDPETEEGFGVGDTTRAKTKGILIHTKTWICADSSIGIMMDGEGTGDIDSDETHSSRILALQLLLSSCFIYNSMGGSITENHIQQLHLVANISKHIRLHTVEEETKNKNDENEEDREVATVEQLAEHFGDLWWLMRDASLELEHGSANEYLNHAVKDPSPPAAILAKNEDAQKQYQSKKRVRRLIRAVFPQRQCRTLIRPCREENDLKSLDFNRYKKSVILPEYLKQIDALRNDLKNIRRPKMIMDGKPITGEAHALLAEKCCNAMNQNVAPSIIDTFSSLADSLCRQATEDAFSVWKTQSQAWLNTRRKSSTGSGSVTVNPEELQQVQEKDWVPAALEAYKKRAFGDIAGEREFLLRRALQEEVTKLHSQNIEHIQNRVLLLAEQLQAVIVTVNTFQEIQNKCQRLEDSFKTQVGTSMQVMHVWYSIIYPKLWNWALLFNSKMSEQNETLEQSTKDAQRQCQNLQDQLAKLKEEDESTIKNLKQEHDVLLKEKCVEVEKLTFELHIQSEKLEAQQAQQQSKLTEMAEKYQQQVKQNQQDHTTLEIQLTKINEEKQRFQIKLEEAEEQLKQIRLKTSQNQDAMMRLDESERQLKSLKIINENQKQRLTDYDNTLKHQLDQVKIEAQRKQTELKLFWEEQVQKLTIENKQIKIKLQELEHQQDDWKTSKSDWERRSKEIREVQHQQDEIIKQLRKESASEKEQRLIEIKQRQELQTQWFEKQVQQQTQASDALKDVEKQLARVQAHLAEKERRAVEVEKLVIDMDRCREERDQLRIELAFSQKTAQFMEAQLKCNDAERQELYNRIIKLERELEKITVQAGIAAVQSNLPCMPATTTITTTSVTHPASPSSASSSTGSSSLHNFLTAAAANQNKNHNNNKLFEADLSF
jgi:hypothetical protein